MRNILANIPFLKVILHFVRCVFYKFKSKNLKFGYNNIIKKCEFQGYNVLGDNVTIQETSLGVFSYVSNKTQINKTKIGKFCSIGPSCIIGLGIHPTNDFISTHPIFYSSNKQSGTSFLKNSKFQEFKEIKIGHDVWIGAGSIILDGIEIGNGAIVAAGSVVTKNVEPFSIVAGVPAQFKKYKFSQNQIEEIKKSPWWEKDIEEIKSMIQSS